MKKMIIIVVSIVIGYMYVSDGVINDGVNSIKGYNSELEMVMDSMN